MFVLYMLC